MKLLIRLGIVAIVVVILGVVILTLTIDRIAKSRVERSATESMDVPTMLESATVSIFAGGFAMDSLHVSNPEGYQADHFLTLGQGNMKVSLGTLMSDTVHLSTLHLNDLSIVVEKVGSTSNLDVIMANIGRARDSDAAKKYKVDEVVLRNVTLTVILPPISSSQKPLIVRVPEIRLEDVGSDSEAGVVLSQLTGTIITATLHAIVEHAPDALPALVTTMMDGALAKAGAIGEIAERIGGDAAVRDITQKVIGDLLEGRDPGKQVEEGARDLLRNLTPGNDREENDN